MLDSLRAVVKTAENDSTRARAYIDLAGQLQNSDLQEALQMARKAEELSEKNDDSWALAKSQSLLAGLYLELGAVDRGVRLAHEALATFKKLNDTLELARSSNLVGMLQKSNKESARALESYDAAFRYYEMLGRKRGMALARNNKAIVFSEIGESEKAMEIYRENLAMDPPASPLLVASTYNNIGTIFFKEANYDSSLYYSFKALEIKRNLDNDLSLANTMNNIASAYLRIDDMARSKLYLDSAKSIILQSGDVSLLMENLDTEAELQHKLGNDRAAYLALRSYTELKDSVFDKERVEQITQLNTAYETESKQAKIDLLEKGNQVAAAEKNRLQWISVVLTAGFALLALVLVMSIRRARERSRTSRELLAKNREIEAQREEIIAQNDELSQQNHRLAELNREKDGLIGIVAHDIRAPLNRSAALAELIAAVGPLNEEQRKFAEMIGRVSEEGGRLIQDLLELNAYERKDARIDFADTDINEMLANCADGFSPQCAAKDITLHVKPLPNRLLTKTDEKLLTRILDNLLSNALKFTHPGKNIYLTAELSDDKVLLHVKDEGQGISKEDQKKMFRKFQRLSARPTGGESSTGLGLSIVKTLVERLEGEVMVESEVGIGSTFSVSLPLKKEENRLKIG